MPAQLKDEELFAALDAEQYFDKVYEAANSLDLSPQGSVALRSSAIHHGVCATPLATRLRLIPKLTLVSSNIPKKTIPKKRRI